MTETNPPAPTLQTRIYDSLVAFNTTACWQVLQHPQMRQYLAEHLAADLAASVPAFAPTDRAALSARLWAIAEHHIVAEWICCEPINPEHDLCVQGDATRQMVKALLVDDPEAIRPAPLLDAVLPVLPANWNALVRETGRLRLEAIELHDQAAEIDARVAEFELRGTGEIRAAALTEAADFLRDAHFRDGLTVQEIGTAIRHWADRELAAAASGSDRATGETADIQHRGASLRDCLACRPATEPPDPPYEPQWFGIPGCTCKPWTNENGRPRFVELSETVGRVSGWHIHPECPHHAPPAAVAVPAPASNDDPTHGLSVQHADALWDAVAIPGPTEPTFVAQHERVCRTVADLLAIATAPVPDPDTAALDAADAEGRTLAQLVVRERQPGREAPKP